MPPILDGAAMRSTTSPGSPGTTSASRAGQVAFGPSDMNTPPPVPTKRARRSPRSSDTCTSLRITTAAARASASVNVVGVRAVSSTRGDSPVALAQLAPRRFADGQRARQVERLLVGAAAADQEGVHRLGRRDDEVEYVVALQGVVRQAHRTAHVARGDGERGEGHVGRAAGADARG